MLTRDVCGSCSCLAIPLGGIQFPEHPPIQRSQPGSGRCDLRLHHLDHHQQPGNAVCFEVYFLGLEAKL